MLDMGHNADSDLGGGADRDHRSHATDFLVSFWSSPTWTLLARWFAACRSSRTAPTKTTTITMGIRCVFFLWVEAKDLTRLKKGCSGRGRELRGWDGCHKTRDPTAHPSDADSDTDGNTESAGARARVLDRASRQQASAPAKHKRTAAMEPLKRERGASTPPAASVLVKRAVTRTPAPALKPEPPSPEKKISLYADIEDSDGDLFASNSSADVPLAATLAASRTGSRATSVLSSLHEDEDVPMPAAAPMPAGPPDSPTVSSVSSLSATSATPSAFSSISGALRATSATAAPSALDRAGPPATHMLFNRAPLVLYDDPKAAVAERKPGESMEVVEAGKFLSWISTLGRSANMLYNRNTKVLYDDLKAAVEERTPGKSMQVVEPDELVEWISTLGSLGK
ncbi:hypothetical protein K438DRAFT_1749057 [Mycena galopus ATCC 62051]|nr:hypothetical protein K438DRAFT_1749057 [Mycena galopus ATCC 62051]